MTDPPERLLRLGDAFGARAKALEWRLVSLERLKLSREKDLTELHQALAVPIVAALPVFLPSLRRINQLTSDMSKLEEDIVTLRKQLIEAHARSELSLEIARVRIAARAATREADELLEKAIGPGQSSLRQDGND